MNYLSFFYIFQLIFQKPEKNIKRQLKPLQLELSDCEKILFCKYLLRPGLFVTLGTFKVSLQISRRAVFRTPYCSIGIGCKLLLTIFATVVTGRNLYSVCAKNTDKKPRKKQNNNHAKSKFAVLRPTPGSRRSFSIVSGTFPL